MTIKRLPKGCQEPDASKNIENIFIKHIDKTYYTCYTIYNKEKQGDTKMKYNVEYQGGESREIPGVAVDYMLANVMVDGEEIELYAEKEAEKDETATYEDLKAMILEQAKEYGIAAESLSFYYDD